MKNLYLILFSLTSLIVSPLFGQPLANREQPGFSEPHQFNRKSVVPFVGFSVAVPLFKKYSRNRQLEKLSRLPQPPVSQTNGSARVMEDGPTAWEYTGEGVTVYVRGSGGGGYYGGGYGGGGGGNGGSWCGGCDQDQPPPGSGGSGNNDYFLPRPLMNARKVDKNYCENGKNVFKNMWDRQTAVNKEQIALVTDGGIFWLDDVNNTRTTGDLGQAWEYSGPAGGKFFMVNGQIYTITAIVHTHPPGGLDGVSGTSHDLGVSSAFGVPIYAISPNGIYRGLPNGYQDVMSNNGQLAFDCMIANNLFGI